LMHRWLRQAAGPKVQSEPTAPPPSGKQICTAPLEVPSEERSLPAWHENPVWQAEPDVPHALVQSCAVPVSRQSPAWEGAWPGEQSSRNEPPNGAQTPPPAPGGLLQSYLSVPTAAQQRQRASPQSASAAQAAVQRFSVPNCAQMAVMQSWGPWRSQA